MAEAFQATNTSAKTVDSRKETSELTSPPYCACARGDADFCRTWRALVCALQHRSYTAPSLKSTLSARLSQLQNCADAYSFTRKPAELGDFVILDNVKYCISTLQRVLADKLSKEVQLESNDAFKIVLQQGQVGVTELDRLVRAYMVERISVLRVMTVLFRLGFEDGPNKMTRDLAKELVSEINRDTELLVKLVKGIRKRVEELSNPTGSLLWSRQVNQVSFVF